jgi:hypothetical protein
LRFRDHEALGSFYGQKEKYFLTFKLRRSLLVFWVQVNQLALAGLGNVFANYAVVLELYRLNLISFDVFAENLVNLKVLVLLGHEASLLEDSQNNVVLLMLVRLSLVRL